MSTIKSDSVKLGSDSFQESGSNRLDFTTIEKEAVRIWHSRQKTKNLLLAYDDSFEFLDETLVISVPPDTNVRWLVHKTPHGAFAVREWPGIAEIVGTLAEALDVISKAQPDEAAD